VFWAGNFSGLKDRRQRCAPAALQLPLASDLKKEMRQKIGNNSERQHEIDFIPTRMQQQASKALIKRAMLRTNSTGMVGRQ
jgi:hypothetical protein